jgi:hypothetical protein
MPVDQLPSDNTVPNDADDPAGGSEDRREDAEAAQHPPPPSPASTGESADGLDDVLRARQQELVHQDFHRAQLE